MRGHFGVSLWQRLPRLGVLKRPPATSCTMASRPGTPPVVLATRAPSPQIDVSARVVAAMAVNAAASLVREPQSSNRRQAPVLAATASARESSKGAKLAVQTPNVTEMDAVTSLLHFRTLTALPANEPRGNRSGDTSPTTTELEAAPECSSKAEGKNAVSRSPQARHNATERRRVQKLKTAFTELDEQIRSRPDLGLGFERAPVVPGAKRPRNEPSHLSTLQDSAECICKLFELVDDLARRNAELSAAAATTA